ncbi:hypothetical protein AB6A40_007031 [Gnathostoma spinigerum]|uniref:Uncharacterized protein n=1 Tax=Gnathostoma spinigerum TaxID=75299 RepID=A0ABD6EM85_9BILA
MVPPRTKSVVKLVRSREIYGSSKALSSFRYRTRIDQLLFPSIVVKRGYHMGAVHNILYEGVFLGLSHDSKYLICLMNPSFDNHLPGFPAPANETEDDFDELNAAPTAKTLIVLSVSPRSAEPAFIAHLSRTSAPYVYATFPLNSSFISLITFPDNPTVERAVCSPQTIWAHIDFILFKNGLHFSMEALTVISCRWSKKKISKTFLRSTDFGAILNAGIELVSFLFTKSCPRLANAKSRHRKVWKVIRNKGEHENMVDPHFPQGINIRGITVREASPMLAASDRSYGRLDPVITTDDYSAKSSSDLYFCETVLDIERVIHTVMPKTLEANGEKFVAVFDYEMDVVETEGFVAQILVSCVLEAQSNVSGDFRCFIGVFTIDWNMFEGRFKTYSWNVIREIPYRIAQQPNLWYPFTVRRMPHADEKMLSNEQAIEGQSLALLSTGFPGVEFIGFEKDLPFVGV